MDLCKDRICEYFDAEVKDKYISWKDINNPTNEIEFIFNHIIISVYERWKNNN